VNLDDDTREGPVPRPVERTAAPSRGLTAPSLLEALAIWWWFELVVFACPIGYEALSALTSSSSISYTAIVSHGELLIIAVGIAGGSIGHLSRAGRVNRLPFFISLLGSNVLVIAIASFWFASVQDSYHAGTRVNTQGVMMGSTVILGFGLVASLFSVLFAEGL
jgi:hypothetical protein